ncbi:hypothetical protein [Desulfofustis glycolicus]|uniref:DUF4878 domain-containing protein n=1 Tax=Desulfofustis glycolicus DSM 9705 TaxID=1121409 RepID=A0A1M5YKY3_9BACT|nr:hypothetical protein [Desulfofustis glycolicus]MCB2214764.1 hypothetical protein [Desulfobulbaceae bacterium]SHI12569.1 hypothetical protein SAMN02745124_04156 [Desulfofustis glycolicus DSM 9705]
MRISNRRYRLRSRLLLLLAVLALLLPAACSEEQGPEAIARSFVAASKEAVQERRLRDLRDLIAEEYADPAGRTAQDVLAVAAGYLMRNRSVHIYTRLQAATEQDGRIQATVLVALAGRPISDVSMLPSINADLYRFELELVEQEGDWQLASATWRTALVDDFFAD